MIASPLRHRRVGALRKGMTLVELLIFLAILGVLASTLLPLLFSTTEDRLLQQTASIVEQNGQQILQTIGYHVRHAEKILDPSLGSTGSVLAVQTGSGVTDPTIFGVSTGVLLLVRSTVKEAVSSTQVSVGNFEVYNTSLSASRQSVRVRFSLTRTIRLQAPRTYTRRFEAVFVLQPDDILDGNPCGCAVPGCGAGGVYAWQVCQAGSCLTAETQMVCR